MPLTSIALRLCIPLFVLVSATPLLAAGLTPAARQFLDSHCADCHDADEKKGGFSLEKLDAKHVGADQMELMVRLFDRTLSGEMPPKKKAQPTPEARKAFLTELGTTLLAKETELAGESGRTSVRRMNRVEYENTLRDLLGLPLLRVQESLPEDGQQFGFDKVAGALDISHVQMTKYLASADRALHKALVPTGAQPEVKTWREPAAKQDTVRAAISIHSAAPLKGHQLAPGLSTSIAGNPRDDFGNCYRAAHFNGEADSVAVLTGVIGAHQPEGIQIDRFNPPSSGWYKVKFSTWGLRWERNKAVPAVRGRVQTFETFALPAFQDEKGRWQLTKLPQEKPDKGYMQNVEFYGEGETTEIIRASLKGKVIGFFDAPSMKPKVHEFSIWLNPGERISFHAMTLPSSGAASWPSLDGVASYAGPGLAYDWFEVTGPLNDQWPPASQRSLFGEKMPTGKPSAEEQRKLLHSFATRAFRRPVTADELAPYAAIIAAELERGTKFEEAMFAGYKAVLCSPDFLFIGLESGVPQRAANGRARLGDHALASRLSYFLWNSMPDAALLALAEKKTLAQPATLKAQVERMLADPRAERFVEHFTDEWLELKKIDFTTPDPALYPEFDPWLHDSMLDESRATFRRLLTQNRSVRELIASDTILINQRLAELYGIHGVDGAELREVKVPAGSPRGGFLTQASVLKVTANGTATSPVLRGVWVMERILGIPRQPPPPNIPAVEPDATGAVTIRQMIEKHRADTACASCHAKMDPPGMALESFDVIGGHRDRYRLAGGAKKGEPSVEIFGAKAWQNRSRIRLGSEVDASGELADGEKFADLNGYRALLLKNEDALARNVARQLIIYATGAGIRFSDRAAIEGIVAKTKPSQHGIRSLVHEVVASELFQTK